MTLVLDSHGLTMLASGRARLEELRRRGEWPAVIPAVVLTGALSDPKDLRALASHTINRVTIAN